MKSERNLPNNLLKALGEHRPLVMDLGDNVLLHLSWNPQLQLYEDEMGTTSMELLIQIANNEVEIKNKQVKLYEV